MFFIDPQLIVAEMIAHIAEQDRLRKICKTHPEMYSKIMKEKKKARKKADKHRRKLEIARAKRPLNFWGR